MRRPGLLRPAAVVHYMPNVTGMPLPIVAEAFRKTRTGVDRVGKASTIEPPQHSDPTQDVPVEFRQLLGWNP